MPFSLIELLRQRYLDTIQSVKPTNGRWKILVLDKHSQSLIYGVLKTFEILELGVQQIDLIENNRNPSPNLDAIYILAPTAKNVDRIISDFAPPGGSSRKGTPSGSNTYAGAHMFFVDALDDLLVNRLTSSPAAPFLRQLIELFTNISADEPQVYTLRPPNPRSLITLYGPPPRSPRDALEAWEDEVCWISKSLINLFATLGEKPYIRYYNPSSPPLGPAALAQDHLCKSLAASLEKDLAAYCDSNEEFPPVLDPPRPRGTMFIVERAMDLFSPLLHEFTYQSMCHDLLEITDGNKYCHSYRDQSGEIEEKEHTLGEEDKVWVEVRHMHMKDALDKLINDFKNYASEHGHLANGSSLNDMKDMLASLPHLKESKEKLSLHLSMAETCMELFEKHQLMNIASVEQCCSTGMTAEGRTPKSIVEEMVPLLDDRSISTSDKLRIVALYVLYRDGVPDEDRRRLYQHARLALHEMDAVNNMVFLGANVTKDSGKRKKALFKQPLDENAYDISRFQPVVKLMLQDAVSGKLDQTVFPYMGDNPSNAQNGSGPASSGGAPTSLRSAKPSWQRPRSKIAPANRERLMVFVAGGLTYAEVRAAYEISEAHSKDVIIGSTHLYTPKKYIADLANLDRGGSSQGLGPPVLDSKSSSRPSKPKPVEPRDRLKAADTRYAHENSYSGPPASAAPPSRRDYPPAPPPNHRPPLSAANVLHVPSPAPSSIGRTPMSSPAISSNASINSGGVEKEKKKGFFGRIKK
ncbi:vacuolar sorting protein VPS33/slp1 [Puccinia graminis f. sp. tritici]|uniref:Vacuolar sorting protein VPS33/slp1 n=1 Tax=Puccinia graminis f. sp. tritici TaxID=56615 RepID=A0A5B0SFP0_PUCGR|nr:vacuolar sorting protein VPS33/slp1 [Puccinia graminis f. sp. tritici]